MTPPEGEAAHFRALESLYAHAPINRLFESTLEVPGPGLARIRFMVDERHYHAAGAAHGTSYFKMLDDAAFYAANSLVTDRFLLTTAVQPAAHAPAQGRAGHGGGALDQWPAPRLRGRRPAGRCQR